MIAITGYSGFIGLLLLNGLTEFEVLLIGRKQLNANYQFLEFDLNSSAGITQSLSTTTTLIHLAARAHVIKESSVDPLSEFRAVNTKGTLNLARQAAEAGVKRFIFLSSIGVNGISNTSPFSVDDSPAPIEDYATSKLEAEIGLREISKETGMEVVIIRPPLVYGPNAPGNFGKLTNLARKNLPLPFGAIYNKRSLVSIDNLVDLIVTCIDHPKAANETFLVSDDYDVSTTQLLSSMTLAAGKKPRLLPVPVSWLNLIGKLTGKQAVIERLCSSLQVDIRHTKDVLGWKPPVSFEDGINKCFEKSK